MNLIDLRDALARQADQIDPSEPAPIAALRHRVDVVRRRRASGALAIIAALVAGSMALATDQDGTTRPAGTPSSWPTAVMPSEPLPQGPDDTVQHGVRYLARIGDERLVAAKVGARGESRIEFRATLPRDVTFQPFCSADTSFQLELTVDGKAVRSRWPTCGGDRGPTPPEHLSFSSDDVQLPRLPADRPVTIQVQLRHRAPTAEPIEPGEVRGLRIGLGIYHRGRMRDVGGYRLPESQVFQGVTYRLADSGNAPLRAGSSVRLSVPAGTPSLVRYAPGRGQFVDPAVELDIPDDVSWTDGSGVTTVIRPPGEGGSVVAAVRRPPPEQNAGPLVLAIYLPDR